MPSAGTDVIVTIRTAEEAVAVAREYAESIADGTIERDPEPGEPLLGSGDFLPAWLLKRRVL